MATSAMSLEDSVEAKLSILRPQAPQWRTQPFTIFRVPSYVRESNRTAYEPRMVSIGPYYRGNHFLRAMEEHKWRYLHDFLSRSTTLSSSTLVEEVRSLEARARACYSERPELKYDDFLQMLLLDGCFIIEFFYKWHTEEPDVLCDVGWGMTLITNDMLLLDNQIPFFVIEKLYGLLLGSQGSRQNLLNLLLEYIGPEPSKEIPSDTCDIHHLLHLYHESFVPKRPPGPSPTGRKKMATPPKRSPSLLPTTQGKTKKPPKRVIPNATEMSAAGVSFVKSKKPRDMYDITFHRHRGVMKIPPVVIDDMQRPLLVNLIALEQTQGMEEALVLTSWVSLMGMLVRTAQDVALLRRHGILDNLMADDEEAANFFRHLGDGGTLNYDRLVFTEMHDEVRRYCDSWWHSNMAVLRRDYFSNPWTAIAVIGTALALALTATQTYFTIYPKQ